MKQRSTSEPRLREVDGEKDLVVVIPTADYDGEMATRCREEVFKGQHIIFVESREFPDPFFNFAKFVNAGFTRALDYNPDWVAYSGDDVYKIDDLSTLKQGLSRLASRNLKTVFFDPPGTYYSVPSTVVRFNSLFLVAMFLLGGKRKRFSTLLRKYRLRYAPASPTALRKTPRFMYEILCRYIDTNSLGVYSSAFVKSCSGRPFDQVYINSHEETDLAIQLAASPSDYAFVKYRVGTSVGATLGQHEARALRAIAGLSYLNQKLEDGALRLDGLG
ncbi:MAG: hypothetical protein WA688_03785 [Thermoplasmata archaeon]